MAPWTLGRKKTALPVSIPPPESPPSLQSFAFESEFSHHRPSDLSGLTLHSYDPTLEGEITPSSISHVKSFQSQQLRQEEERKGGKGIKGLFARSSSYSNLERKAKQSRAGKDALPPPLPTAPTRPSVRPSDMSGHSAASGNRLAQALPILEQKDLATKPALDGVDELFASFAASEDLAALLSLVQYGTSTTTPTERTTNSPLSTPQLSSSSSTSSPSESHATIPTPYYSFLSHLSSPNSTPQRPPFSRSLPPVPVRSKAPRSDDEYGSGMSKKVPLWTKKSNAGFKPAKVETSSGSRVAKSSDAQKRALGIRGKAILELTTLRLSLPSTTSPSIQHSLHPVSTNRHPISLHSRDGGNGSTLRTILGRTAILRKLREGVTTVEKREIEVGVPSRGGPRDSMASEASDWSIGSSGKIVESVAGEVESILRVALQPYSTGFDSIAPTTQSAITSPRSGTSTRPARPHQFPTAQSMRIWIARRRFSDTHLVITAAGEGTAMNLIRATRAPLTFSPRLLGIAAIFILHAESDLVRDRQVGDRPTRDSKPGFGERRNTTKELPSILRRIESPRHDVGGVRIPMPGPLLLRALAETNVEDQNRSPRTATGDEDELPLAGLRARTLPSPFALLDAQDRLRLEHEESLRVAQQENDKLAAEVTRLRQRERRVERERERENLLNEEARRRTQEEKETQRRLAEQHRRARAMEPLPLHARNRIVQVELTREPEK